VFSVALDPRYAPIDASPPMPLGRRRPTNCDGNHPRRGLQSDDWGGPPYSAQTARKPRFAALKRNQALSGRYSSARCCRLHGRVLRVMPAGEGAGRVSGDPER
jgi:hypothetical protein